MKATLVALSAMLTFSQLVYPQEQQIYGDEEYLLLKSDQEQIRDIDEIIHEIKTNLKNCNIMKGLINKTDSLFIYKKDKKTQLISTHINDTIQNLTYEKNWYIKEGHIIYAEQLVLSNSMHGLIDKEKMYFERERLFTWIRSGSKTDPNSMTFKKAAIALNDQIEVLKSKYLK